MNCVSSNVFQEERCRPAKQSAQIGAGGMSNSDHEDLGASAMLTPGSSYIWPVAASPITRMGSHRTERHVTGQSLAMRRLPGTCRRCVESSHGLLRLVIQAQAKSRFSSTLNNFGVRDHNSDCLKPATHQQSVKRLRWRSMADDIVFTQNTSPAQSRRRCLPQRKGEPINSSLGALRLH